MKVAFYTLGCKVNQYETDIMMKDFQEKGYNMNKIKSILHNKVLLSLMKKDNRYVCN